MRAGYSVRRTPALFFYAKLRAMKKLLVIVGPTGTGKSDLALELANEFNGELVSADSRQLYIGMDIGTGKETEESGYKITEKRKGSWIVNDVPIHLYDVISPDKTFSVASYQQLAYKAIEQIERRNKLPILVGGTGLYVRAVTEGLKIPKAAPDQKLRNRLESRSLSTLVDELKKVDPDTAAGIDTANPRRVVRALEVFYTSGRPLSKLKAKFEVHFNCLKIGLRADRDYLYKKVDAQVEKWFEQGFADEVKNLIVAGYTEDLSSMTSLGYRQVAMYLKKKLPLQEAKQRIKWEQHGYIRRQLTWFKKDSNVYWFDIAKADFRKQIYDLIGKWRV